SAHFGRAWRYPALVERPLDNRHLYRLDGHRVVVDAEHARAFTRRRAQTSRELREVVRGMQAVDCRPPSIAIDEVVPVRDEITERTTLVAERNAAVHATGGLAGQDRLRVRKVDLVPIVHSLRHRTSGMFLALNFDETSDFPHALRSELTAESAEFAENF